MNRAQDAADFLVGLRAPGAVLPDDIPDEFRPHGAADVVQIQLATIRKLGPVGGWKIGALGPAAIPLASPLPASGITRSPAVVQSRFRGIEAEIGFRFGRALPARAAPYGRDEVIAAIEKCQATIELIDPRFRDFTKLDPLVVQADLGVHGGLVVGDPVASWQPDMFVTVGVELTIDGAVCRTGVGCNPGGIDLVRLLVGLANSEIVRLLGGIAAGAVVTTGSWTGAEIVSPGGTAVARFDGFPPVEVRFSD